jgi:hypothetical protein
VVPVAAVLFALALAAPPPLLVSLRIRVAACLDAAGARGPSRPPEWVAQHVEAVRTLFAAHGIAVTARSESFAPVRCEALSREDRDAFAAEVDGDGQVTVLVVPRVRDLDVPSYDLRGVHWRAGGRRWIFLTARARPPVLAHELGHFFGLPHDPAGGNLMTPGPSSPAWRSKRPPRPFAPGLTADQVRRLRAGIAAFAPRSGRQATDVAGEVGR